MTEATKRTEFETFFRSQYVSVVRALTLLVLEDAEAEDLAQEAFARTYERWERARDMQSPAGYVYKIAFNLHRRRRRRARRMPRFLIGDPQPPSTLGFEDRLLVRRAIAA